MATLKASIFATMLCGCVATAACAAGCSSGEPSSSDLVADVDSTSPKTFSSEGGNVSSWKFYNEDEHTIRVLGKDKSGKVVAELLLTVDANDRDQLQEVMVETIRPERSWVRFEPGNDGKGKIEKSTDKAIKALQVFDTLDEDVQTYIDAGSQGPHTRGAWDCITATLAMVGACGATAATCVETGGIGCYIGYPGCAATVVNYFRQC
jgi:hypothetical protein